MEKEYLLDCLYKTMWLYIILSIVFLLLGIIIQSKNGMIMSFVSSIMWLICGIIGIFLANK